MFEFHFLFILIFSRERERRSWFFPLNREMKENIAFTLFVKINDGSGRSIIMSISNSYLDKKKNEIIQDI